MGQALGQGYLRLYCKIYKGTEDHDVSKCPCRPINHIQPQLPFTMSFPFSVTEVISLNPEYY